MTPDAPELDDALIEACQHEQQRVRGYSETRDEIARTIVSLLSTSADLTRDQVIAHFGRGEEE